jgi:[ribosomal protein S18]-alanine N-acetyltransferase
MMRMYTLRYMTLDDIPQVVDLDRLSFPLPWSARSYTFEINDNLCSHMVVLEDADLETQPIIGYGGWWQIDGEAHISTIAVHPECRGRGLGEVLLAGMLNRASDLQAEYAVLEVRLTNTNAQNLYHKYEFEVVGRRRHYYRDNNEDALQMHLSNMDSDNYRARFTQRLNALRERVQYADLLHLAKPQPDK